MNSTRIFVISSWLIILLLSIPFGLIGQTTLQYKGPFKIRSYEGQAQFQYQMVEGDTLFTGPFSLKRTNPEQLLNQGDRFFSITGGFEAFIPAGPWVFSFGSYQSGNTNAAVVDHQYRLNVNGIHHEALGTLNEGKPQGTWIQKVVEIEQSEEVATLFESQITFDAGIPQKSFSIRNESMTLIGRFLRDGLAHDVWELFDQSNSTAVEQWYFQDGRLEKVVISGGEADQVLEVFQPMEDPQILTINRHYLDILNLYLTLTAEGLADQGGIMDQLLKENAGYYQKIDDILTPLGGTAFTAEFKVKVSHYPLIDSELMHLDSINYLYTNNQIIATNLLKNTQLKLLELSDYEVLYLKSVLQVIHDHHLAIIGEVVTYHQNEVLAYVPRTGPLLEKLWKTGEPDPAISVTYDSAGQEVNRIYLGPSADRYDWDTNGLEGILQLSKYVNACLATISNDLNQKLSLKQREQALMEWEEQLIDEVSKLNNLLDSLSNEELEITLASIQDASKKELSAYSRMENTPEKITRVQELIDCFENMSGLAISISLLEDRREEIKEVYTDDVWNPFTYTVMSEAVKNRITTAYNEVLIPYVIREVEKNLSCEHVEYLTMLLDNIHQRMLALRTEDTDRMEKKKLKNEKDPKVILQLFGINPVNNTAE